MGVYSAPHTRALAAVSLGGCCFYAQPSTEVGTLPATRMGSWRRLWADREALIPGAGHCLPTS